MVVVVVFIFTNECPFVFPFSEIVTSVSLYHRLRLKKINRGFGHKIRGGRDVSNEWHGCHCVTFFKSVLTADDQSCETPQVKLDNSSTLQPFAYKMFICVCTVSTAACARPCYGEAC